MAVTLEGRHLGLRVETVVASPLGHPEPHKAVHGAAERRVPADVLGVGTYAETKRP